VPDGGAEEDPLGAVPLGADRELPGGEVEILDVEAERRREPHAGREEQVEERVVTGRLRSGGTGHHREEAVLLLDGQPLRWTHGAERPPDQAAGVLTEVARPVEVGAEEPHRGTERVHRRGLLLAAEGAFLGPRRREEARDGLVVEGGYLFAPGP